MNAPFSYSYQNQLEGTTSPSFLHIHNTGTAIFFKRYLMQEAISIFKWTLPKNWDADYFRYILMGWGFLAVFKTDKFGIIPNQCTLSGLNVFYRPNKVIVANPLINAREMVIGRDCEIIKLMPDYGNVSDLVDQYGDLMALAYETLSTNILNSKVSFVFGADNKSEADTFKSLFDDVASGNPCVIYKKRAGAVDKTPWQTFTQNVGQNLIADRLLETLSAIRDDFLTHIGVPNLSTRKKERVNLDESQKNTFETQTKLMLWLDELQDSIKRVKAMFPELEELNVEPRFNMEEGASNGD